MTIAQRISQIHQDKEQTRLVKMFFAAWRYKTLAQKDGDDPTRLAMRDRALPPIVAALECMQGGRIEQVLKTAVQVGSTSGTWGADLSAFTLLQDTFFASLRNISIWEAALPFMKQVPLHSSVPIITTGPTATTAGEGMVKPVTTITYGGNISLTEKKTPVIVGLSDELVRFVPGGLNYFQGEMTQAVASAVDSSFISEITSGISVSPSNGSTSTAVLQDIDNAVRSLTRRSGSQIFIAVSADIAAAWALKVTSTGALLFPGMMEIAGGSTVQGIRVFATDGVSSKIVCFDASQILASDVGMDLDASNEASIQYDTSPDSPAGASTPYVSAWQMNITLARATRWWSAKRSNNTCVSVISPVSYTGDSPQ